LKGAKQISDRDEANCYRQKEKQEKKTSHESRGILRKDLNSLVQQKSLSRINKCEMTLRKEERRRRKKDDGKNGNGIKCQAKESICKIRKLINSR
jgi:hypothetical protein